MEIGNIRVGHATSSSSTHQIVFLSSAAQRRLKRTIAEQKANSNEGVADGVFGWQNFVLTTTEEKLKYLFAIITEQYGNMDSSLARAIAVEVLGNTARPGASDGFGVDHQSRMALPSPMGNAWHAAIEPPDSTFLAELTTFLLREDVVILGGNDNSDEGNPLLEYSEGIANLPLGLDGDVRSVRARKDGDWWTLYNSYSGTRATFSFLQNPAPLGRPDAPFLVDVGITDACEHECPFCYHNAQPNGAHCDFTSVQTLADIFARMGVLEVVLGGGDPILHPQFPEILHTFGNAGITVNFSTRTLNFFQNAPLALAVYKHCRAVGISVGHANEIRDFVAYRHIWEQREFDRFTAGRVNRPYCTFPSFRVHVPLGCVDPQVFTYICEAAGDAGLGLLLLGYKHTGRTEKWFGIRKHQYTSDPQAWMDECKEPLKALLKKDRFPEIAFDTELAKRWEPLLKELGVPEFHYSTVEGQHSMHIDLVGLTAGASSFCPKEERIDITVANAPIKEAWKAIGGKE